MEIIDLRDAEAEARRIKERLELVVRRSRSSTWDFDLDAGELLDSRGTFTNVWELLGHDAPDGPDGFRGYVSLVVDDERAAFVDAVHGFLAGGATDFEYELRVRHHDGSDRWQLARGFAVRDDRTGRALQFSGTSVDITDRKRIEQELRDSEARSRGMFENAAVGMALNDARGFIAECNDRFSEFFGYTRHELAGRSFRDLMPAEEVGVEVERVQRLVRGEIQMFTRDKHYLRKDGTREWGNITVSVIRRNASGTPEHLLAVLQDISARKQLEADLQTAKERAEAANRAKDEFLANVSHEIRTPMNAILGMTELALDASNDAHQRQLLSTVKTAARNLLGIINDLLDFSKITAGKVELVEEPFGLRGMLGATVRALAARAHRKGLEVVCRVEPDVPDALLGDAGRLRQVLMNLISNAIKFTPKGEVTITVATATAATPAPEPSAVVLVFEVRDTGIGIPRAKHAAIFRAFEQEDASTTRKYGGTGLGLTISAGLAELMGGAITVDSEPGRGSTFRFSARFGRSSDLDRSGHQSVTALEDARVLVVDDNAANRHILVEWLTSWRMRPIAVGSAAAAVEAVSRAEDGDEPFDVVLLDARMPDVDGITLARLLRERSPSTAERLILLSSDDTAQVATQSREVGIRAYLLKPVQQSHLLEAIWAVIDEAPVDPPAPDPVVAPGAGYRILVAEDNELNVSLLSALLAKRGHTAKFAGDGRIALELAAEGDHDVMLLDLHMPELDGFEVVQAVRRREQVTGDHLPIIGLTARASQRDRERALAAGMDDFLSKPIEVKVLFAAIERAVAAHPQPRPASRGLLDPRAILRVCGGRRDVLERLCEVFCRSVPIALHDARDALAAGDAARLERIAHTLVGTLGGFSPPAMELAAAIEDAAAAGAVAPCAALIERLSAMTAELVEAARSLPETLLGD